jgi:hypothetical protein
MLLMIILLFAATNSQELLMLAATPKSGISLLIPSPKLRGEGNCWRSSSIPFRISSLLSPLFIVGLVLLIIRRDVVRARPFFARCAAFLRERGDGTANTGVVVVVIIVGDVGMEENAATTASPPPPIKLLQQHNKIINILMERTMKTMPLSIKACLVFVG